MAGPVTGRRPGAVRRPRAAGARALPTALTTALAVLLAAALPLLAVVPADAGHGAPGAPTAAASTDPPDLWLVTLEGRGTAMLPPDRRTPRARALEARQDAVLDSVGAPSPVYRWTTALVGFAVRLDARQAGALAARPDVVAVERNAVRRLAGVRGGSGAPGAPVPGSRGGEGVVVGVVDSGLWPESPVVAPLVRPAPLRGFRGDCTPGEEWPASRCSSKVVGARWFVTGFGAGRLRSTARLSAQDDDGHGTQVASVVAGNSGVAVEAGGEDLGRYGGVAPRARLAVYKACWSAPDPVDDGCATADLVTAVDRATADGVDVLTLAVGAAGPGEGPLRGARHDALDHALLGAAEADVAVVAAAGNAGADGPVGHDVPWVTTVGTALRPLPRGAVRLRDPATGSAGPLLSGAMVSRRGVGASPVVRGADAVAAGASRREAAQCRPGSLDTARVAGAVVVCERGGIGRVDKSAAVGRAQGRGMVLTSPRALPVTSDLHDVPTVHLDRRDSRRFLRWLAAHPDARASLRALPDRLPRRGVAGRSPQADPSVPTVEPDLVAGGTGVLGATPPTVRGTRWDFLSGSSAAAATVAGTAAVLRAQHPGWSAARVRAALATTADRLRGTPVLRQGAGRLAPRAARDPALVTDVRPGDWRRVAEGELAAADLDVPSLRTSGRGTWTRTVTHHGRRSLYYSAAVRGFTEHRVRVRPVALRLDPGERATFTITVTGPGDAPVDDGEIVWRGADGSRTRLPVVLGGPDR